MNKRYRVTLTKEEREELRAWIRNGHRSSGKLLHTRILLKADQGPQGPCWTDERIAEALECGVATIERVRQRFVEEGLERALVARVSTRTYLRKIDGEAEAQLVALSCSRPPEGADRWTLKLLADKLVGLGQVKSVSRETVRQTLKKTNLSLGWSKAGVFRRGRTETLSPAWRTS